MLVKLWDLSGAAIIVPLKTGVVYTNQVSGNACLHPTLEGALIPICNDYAFDNPKFIENMLCAIFEKSWDVISEDKADQIDNTLQQFAETKGIKVDRSCLKESMEAWVHVIAIETEFGCFSGFGTIRGILTWCNSD